jgi:hypothetical protein
VRILLYMHSTTYIAVIIAVLLIIPVTASSVDTDHPGTPGQILTPLIPGTDKPRIQKCSRGTVYQYNEYTIYTKPSKKQAGESIYVHDTDKKDKNLCKVKNLKPLRSYDNKILGGANFFAGLYLDYLFIDQGTGPSYRGLSIYDLKDNKLLFFTNYADPVLSDGTLTYFETIQPSEFFEAKKSCTKSGHWKRDGLRVYYQRQNTYKLDTGKKQWLDKYRCVPGQ